MQGSLVFLLTRVQADAPARRRFELRMGMRWTTYALGGEGRGATHGERVNDQDAGGEGVFRAKGHRDAPSLLRCRVVAADRVAPPVASFGSSWK